MEENTVETTVKRVHDYLISKPAPLSIFDAVKQRLPIMSIALASPDKGRMTIYLPSINHCYTDTSIGDIFEGKSITIGAGCGYFSFTKVEAVGTIALKQKVEQKSYIGVYKLITALPTSMIEEVSLVTSADKWYTSIEDMLNKYQKEHMPEND